MQLFTILFKLINLNAIKKERKNERKEERKKGKKS